MNPWVYCRVSTGKQKKGFGLKNQEERGRTLVASIKELSGAPVRVVREVDSGRKEAIEDRLVLKETLEKLEFGDCVYFDDEDRMARDNGVKKHIIRKLRQKNVRLFVRTREFDLFNIQDILQLGLKGEFDEYIGSWLVQRMQDGRKKAAKKKWMSWLSPYGYRKGKDGKLEVEPNEAEIYNLMVEKASEGWGAVRIARYLNAQGIPTKVTKLGKGSFVWKSGTINRILRNPLYTGKMTYFGHNVSIPALISLERFRVLQEVLKDHWQNRPAKPTKRLYLLQGLLLCGTCSRRFFGKIKESKRCAQCGLRVIQQLRRNPNLNTCPRCKAPMPEKLRIERERCYCCLSKKPDPSPRSCGMPSLNLDEVHQGVWLEARRLATNSQKFREQLKSQLDNQSDDYVLDQAEAVRLNKAIEQKDNQIDALLTNLELLEQPEYVKRNIDRLHQEKEELIRESAKIEERVVKQAAMRQKTSRLETLWAKIGRRIDQLNEQERYDFLHAFFNHIKVNYDPKSKEHLLSYELAVEVEEELLPQSLRSVLTEAKS